MPRMWRLDWIMAKSARRKRPIRKRGCARESYCSGNLCRKSKPHLEAAVALFVAWYNFCRVPRSLRVTPAMESGITDHIWTVAELI